MRAIDKQSIIGMEIKVAAPANKTAQGPSPTRRPHMKTVKYTTKGIDTNEQKMVKISTIRWMKFGNLYLRSSSGKANALAREMMEWGHVTGVEEISVMDAIVSCDRTLSRILL